MLCTLEADLAAVLVRPQREVDGQVRVVLVLAERRVCGALVVLVPDRKCREQLQLAADVVELRRHHGLHPRQEAVASLSTHGKVLAAGKRELVHAVVPCTS